MKSQDVETVIRERLGIDPAALGPAVLPRAIENRMKSLDERSLESYLSRLIADSHEMQLLAEELVVPETWFFRGGYSLYQKLAQIAVNRAGKHPAGVPIRVLSIPCSSGEEPLSLAIALDQYGFPLNRIQIDAVDLSPSHVERAKLGLYSAFVFREPGVDIRPTYFKKGTTHWTPLPHVRKAIAYRTGNIIDPKFLSGELPYDLILCRNLFIYLTPDGRKRAVTNLVRLLAHDGCLCLSSAEADRIPIGQFVSEGPIEFGLYRRISMAKNSVSVKHQIAARHMSSNAIQKDVSPNDVTLLNLSPLSKASIRAANDTSEKSTSIISALSPPENKSLEGARALANAGQLSEARAACEELIRARAVLPDAYSLLGVINHAEGRVSEATEAFRKALYLAPNHIEALTHMIVNCNARGETSQATALQKRLKRLAGEDKS